MKKLIAILLVVLMIITCAVGCADKPTTGAGDDTPTKPSKVQQIVDGGNYDGNNYD